MIFLFVEYTTFYTDRIQRQDYTLYYSYTNAHKIHKREGDGRTLIHLWRVYILY